MTPLAEPLLGPALGLGLILAYGAGAFLLSWLFSRGKRWSRDEFLVAERSLGPWTSGLSVAATWIWAPALFLAAQKAYTHGLVGVFWFTVPNVLCLIVFGAFAQRLRNSFPDGYTLSDWIRQRHSARVQWLYLTELGGLAVCSFAVQLLGGSHVIAALTGLPFFGVTVALALIALSYSARSGIRGSVVTDIAQLLLILGVGGSIVFWAVSRAGGWTTVAAGLGGISGRYSSLWGEPGWEVFLSFGVPVTIGLMAGPFGDQSFWQRAFSVRREAVWGSFLRGALLFALVPLLMSLLGFVAAGSGWELPAETRQLVNLETVTRLLPAWVLVPFVAMLMSGLVSTLDSNLCSISSLAGHDLANEFVSRGPPDDRRVVKVARMAMLFLTGAAIVVANIPGMRIEHLFLIYGSLRATVLLPTILSIVMRRLHEPGVFWGILVAIVGAVPAFAWARLTGAPGLQLTAVLTAVLLPGIVALTLTAYAGRRVRNSTLG